MIRESSDRRAICALSFVDVPTGQPLPGPFAVSAPGASFVRNRQGLYALVSAPGLEDYTREFEAAPELPAIGSVSLTIEARDPSRRYLDRRITIQLPRDPTPQNRRNPTSLFQPVTVRMFPSLALSTLPNWAVVHVTVRRRATNQPIAGALLRVLEPAPNGRVLGRGMTGALGEALVVVAGIRLITSGEGPDVLVTNVPAILEAIAGPDTAAMPDPDSLEAGREQLDSNTVSLSLAAGRSQSATIVTPREVQ